MNCWHRLICCCSWLLPAACAADSLGNVGDVRLKGYAGERLDAMIERNVAGSDIDYITAPFLHKAETRLGWQTEFWGKWMHASVPCLRYVTDGKCKVESVKCKVAEELYSKIERGVERMLASQEESGYIGNYPDELRCGEGWDVWGMKYTMMGLLHYVDIESGGVVSGGVGTCELSDNGSRALAAAKKLCDYVIAEIGPGGRRGRELWQTGNWSGYASSSILEPVVWLYRRVAAKDGKDAARKYLDFAWYIVRGMTEPEAGPRLVDLALKGVSVADRNGYGNKADAHGGYVCKHSRSKAYEMMSCYQGLLDYVEVKSGGVKSGGVKGEDLKNLLRAAVMTAEDIAKEEINLAGGCASSERWFHGATKQHLPYVHLQETCVTITWMRLCAKLLDVTGDAKWADQLERTFYNAYLAALKPDGSGFAAYTPLSGSRCSGMNHCRMHTNCCTANGARGFLCFLEKFFRMNGGAAEFNFYGSALVRGKTPGGLKVAFDMYSLYPRTDNVRIVSHTDGAVPLRLRIPAWSAKTVVRLNGAELGGAVAGCYFVIDRTWRLGDVVDVKFDMPTVAHTLDHHAAFTRGPVLLARDVRFADGDMMEPLRAGAVADGRVMPSFSAVRTPSDDMWMAFSATLPIGSHSENPETKNPTTVFFCDYASAGNTWRRDGTYRTWFPIERIYRD